MAAKRCGGSQVTAKTRVHLSMMLSMLDRPNARHHRIRRTAQPVLTPVTHSSCTEPSCLAFGQRRCWGSCCMLCWRADYPHQVGTAKVTVRALQARGEAREAHPADQRDVLSHHIPGRLNNQMADKARTSRALEEFVGFTQSPSKFQDYFDAKINTSLLS